MRILIALCVVVAILPQLHAVTLDPDPGPRSVPYNESGTAKKVEEIPLGWTSADGKLTNVKTVPGCSPEQVSLMYYGAKPSKWYGPTYYNKGYPYEDGPMSVLISWTTCDPIIETPPDKGDCTGTAQKGAVNKDLVTAGLESVVLWGLKGILDNRHTQLRAKKVTSRPTSYVYDHSPTQGLKYASPLIHHVLIEGLQPGVEYDFMIVDNVLSATQEKAEQRALSSSEPNGPKPYRGSFKAPGYVGRNQFPYRIGVIGDPGETFESEATLRGLLSFTNMDMLFIMGDLIYADEPDAVAPPQCNVDGSITYPYRWDTWGRFMQPLLSRVPFMTLTGNHEMEVLPEEAAPMSHNFVVRQLAYNKRYPAPQLGPSTFPVLEAVLPQPDAPTAANPIGKPSKNAFTNSYYMAEIPGVATTIWLSHYSPYDVNGFYSPNEQILWLEKTLKAIDRSKTPWLIVNMHAPWYISYTSHFKENECFRLAIEPMLMAAGVDVMFFGHMHAYERSRAVYNFKLDTSGCAPVHIIIGDAGNIEDAAKEFIHPKAKGKYLNCSNPDKLTNPPKYQPTACITYNQGPGSGCEGDKPCYCYAYQPNWSAFREPSFGHGRLVINSATEAKWQWIKNTPGGGKVSDEVTIKRGTCNKASAG